MDSQEKKEWLALLESGKAFCYFKPTRYLHGSKFRCLEIGYCTIGNNNRIDRKLVLGQCSDVIDTARYFREKRTVAIDLTKDGYFRIFSRDEETLWWGSLDFVVSSAYICKLGEHYLFDTNNIFTVDNG